MSKDAVTIEGREYDLFPVTYISELEDMLKASQNVCINQKRVIEEIRVKAAHFITKFDENWEHGRVSIDAKDARDSLLAALAKLESTTDE
jgi:hypothetical protein